MNQSITNNTATENKSLGSLLIDAKQEGNKSKTITVYNLAKLVLEYNGDSATVNSVYRFCDAVNRNREVYISFARLRGLI
jgi:hypothetical protein